MFYTPVYNGSSSWENNYVQAYMIVDLVCFLLPLTPNDFLFVGHHFMTSSYMITSVVRSLQNPEDMPI